MKTQLIRPWLPAREAWQREVSERHQAFWRGFVVGALSAAVVVLLVLCQPA
jgi:hypothetical protein